MNVILAVILAALILAVQHWAPWRLMLGRELPRLAAYVMGTLALLLPLTWLFYEWGETRVISALWCVAVGGGFCVMLLYLVDGYIDAHWKKREAEEREALYGEGTVDQGSGRETI